MSDKMHCPACDSVTSTHLSAFYRGDDCPTCGLPNTAWEEIIAVRDRYLEGELLSKYEAAVARAERAERETNRLQAIINRIERAVKER